MTTATRTLTVRVPERLAARLRRYKVPYADLVRELLERETRRREDQEWEERRKKAAEALRGKITTRELVEMIRETREER
jgi:post-segregation antitoxin (ccd killing protein)